METFVRLVGPFLAGMFGAAITAAIAWGAMRNQVGTNAADVKELKGRVGKITGEIADDGQSWFVRRGECNSRSGEIGSQLVCLREKLDDQRDAISGLQNVARHQLTKDGLSVAEINEILNGGD